MLMLGVSRLFHSHYFSPLSLSHSLHTLSTNSLLPSPSFPPCTILIHFLFTSERGNQRERDRERAQARAGGTSKQPKNDGLTPEQRRERDAKALQEKAARKAAQSAGGNNAGGGGGKNRN